MARVAPIATDHRAATRQAQSFSRFFRAGSADRVRVSDLNGRCAKAVAAAGFWDVNRGAAVLGGLSLFRVAGCGGRSRGPSAVPVRAKDPATIRRPGDSKSVGGLA